MGEYADMAIDFGLSMDEYMSNLDPSDPDYDEHWPAIGWRKRKKTCRRCNETGFVWGWYDKSDSWRLFKQGKVHSC